MPPLPTKLAYAIFAGALFLGTLFMPRPDDLQEILMHPQIVGQFRVEGERQHLALPHGDRLAPDDGEDVDALARLRYIGRADEDRGYSPMPFTSVFAVKEPSCRP